MRWVGWLEEEQYLLVWMRAEGRGRKAIAERSGCDRRTASRHWQKALGGVERRLNVPGFHQARAPVARPRGN